jgi:hypothetical protein
MGEPGPTAVSGEPHDAALRAAVRPKRAKVRLAIASVASMASKPACAMGERTKAAWANPGIGNLPTYVAAAIAAVPGDDGNGHHLTVYVSTQSRRRTVSTLP